MLRRPTAMVLCLALLPHVISCTSTKTQEIALPTEQQLPRERIMSITTRQGRVVHFQLPGARLERDTIFGFVRSEPFQMPLEDVERLWVTKTETNTAATIGAVVGVVALAFVAALATKESCPFVYSWDGNKYVFDAEPYGGAITRGLERDDYSELEHLQAVDGLYRLMIANEVRETQFTNLVELRVVDHPPGTRVAADEWGNLHTLQDLQPPESARDHTGRDLLLWLEKTDRLIWEPEAVPDADGNLRHDIVITFPKPEHATKAKLVANAATGLWGSHMIREMLELRGHDVDAWYSSIDESSIAHDSLIDWNLREELYLLKVYVEESTGWELAGVLPGGGPFIAEDRVVPLDVSRVVGDRLRLRIRPPAGFWALNSFAVDYSTNQAVVVDTLAPMEAQDQHGRDVLGELVRTDDRYYIMPETGDRAYVTFPAPAPLPEMERTVLLHSRGYYRLHLPVGGEPDQVTLRRLVDLPGAAARFAAERFAQWKYARRSGP